MKGDERCWDSRKEVDMSDIMVRKASGGVCAPKGFHAAGMHAGFKKSGKKDLALIYSEQPCAAAAAYTTNKVKGVTLTLTEEHLANGTAQAVVVNSGNANTLAPNGMAVARETCAIAAGALGIAETDVLVCSTGVIGQEPKVEPFRTGVPQLAEAVLHPRGAAGKAPKYYGSEMAAQAIMTTDTVKKEIAVSAKIGGKTVKIGGIAKGSGMINPKMATMLIFITSDAAISPKMLAAAMKEDIDSSFNQISVDGDTSTNDNLILMANGLAGNAKITRKGDDYKAFVKALRRVTIPLAKALAKDGEGATKLIISRVSGAPDEQLARLIAKTIIQSDLVKTAIYGSDANWGRILGAVGYAEGDFSTANADVAISSAAGEVRVCKGSFAIPFSEEKAKKVLDSDEILIKVDLHDGKAEAEAYGCDLTYDYVKINGMYRT
jgi:glutamate N-acetyltransferase/amino-acid N-acetyltransferase